MEIPAGRYELGSNARRLQNGPPSRYCEHRADVTLKVPLEPEKYKLTVQATPGREHCVFTKE